MFTGQLHNRSGMLPVLPASMVFPPLSIIWLEKARSLIISKMKKQVNTCNIFLGKKLVATDGLWCYDEIIKAV